MKALYTQKTFHKIMKVLIKNKIKKVLKFYYKIKIKFKNNQKMFQDKNKV